MAYENRPKDFFAKQIRSSHLIASGGIIDPESSDWDEQLPHLRLMIYPRDALETLGLGGTEYIDGAFEGIVPTHLLDDSGGSGLKVGEDVWLFVSGAQNTMHGDVAGQRDNSGVVLFGGDVVVSGTLFAERQVIEVDLSQEGELFISGNLVAQDYIANVNFVQFMGPEENYPRDWATDEGAMLSFLDILNDPPGADRWNGGNIDDADGIQHDISGVEGFDIDAIFTIAQLNSALLTVSPGANPWLRREDIIVEGVVYSAYNPQATGNEPDADGGGVGHTLFNIDSSNNFVSINHSVPSASLDVRRQFSGDTNSKDQVIILSHDMDNIAGSNPLFSNKTGAGVGHHDDTAFYVWGVPGGKETFAGGAPDYNVAVLGGDAVVSGTLYAENGVIDIGSIHDTITGDRWVGTPLGTLRFTARETGSDEAFGIAAQIQVEAAGDWTVGPMVTPARINMYTDDLDNPALTIANTSNIGIGEENPINKLDVAGMVAIGSGYAGAEVAPVNGLAVEGSVGIGTATVETNGSLGLKLDVRGTVTVNSTTGEAESGLHIQRNGGASSRMIKLENEDAAATALPTVGLFHLDEGDFSIGSVWNDFKFHIEANGNVGIGTGVPLSALGVAGGVAIGAYAESNSAPPDGLTVEGRAGFGIPTPSDKSQVHVSGGDPQSENGTNFWPAVGVDDWGVAGNAALHPLRMIGVKEDATDYHETPGECINPRVLVITDDGDVVYTEAVIGKLGQDLDGRFYDDDPASGNGEDAEDSVGDVYDNGLVPGWNGDTLVGHAVDEINQELKTVSDDIAAFAGTQAWDWSDVNNDDIGDYAILKDPNNSVGIGTPTPQTKLHVYGPDGVSATVRIESTSTDADDNIVNPDAHAVVQFAADGVVQAAVGMHIHASSQDPDALLLQSHTDGGDIYMVTQHNQPSWGTGPEDGTLPQITLAGAAVREFAQVLILSGANSDGTGLAADPRSFQDTNFYASGSIGSAVQVALGQVGNSERGTSVFAGDVFVSGTIFCQSAIGFGAGIPNTVLVVDYEASSAELEISVDIPPGDDIEFAEAIHPEVTNDDDDVTFKKRMRVFINGVRIQDDEYILSATGQKFLKLSNIQLVNDDHVIVDVVGNPNAPAGPPAEVDHTTTYYAADLRTEYWIAIPDRDQNVGINMSTGTSRTIKLPYPGDQQPGTEISLKDENGILGDTDTSLYVVAAGAAPDVWAEIDQFDGSYTIGDDGVAQGNPLTVRQAWASITVYTNGIKWFIK